MQDVNVILPIEGPVMRALEATEDKIPKHLIRLKSGQIVLGLGHILRAREYMFKQKNLCE